MSHPVKTAPKVLAWGADLIDDNARAQAEATSRLPFVHGHVALMPDAHWGKGACIGSVIPPARRLQMLQRAEEIARLAHTGQKDKAGVSYAEHPRRVAARCPEIEAQIVAWLHDTVEDTYVELVDLGEEFPDWVVRAVDALTRREFEPTEEYYQRVRSDPLARRVKLADIADNTDPRRLSFLGPETVTRLIKKYARALDALDVPEGEG